MITRRNGIVVAIILFSTFIIYRSWSLIPENISTTTEQLMPSFSRPKSDALSPEVLTYFDHAFSLNEPKNYDFPALTEQCKQTKWPEDDVYLKCGGMAAGLTSIMSQVKVCMKMALDAGVNIVLPAMPLRSSTDLKDFNFLNPDAYLTYDKWFDQEHFIKQIERACPKMKVIHPDDIKSKKVEVANEWGIDISKAPGFVPFQSYFWAGRPFKTFFEAQYKAQEQLALADPGRDQNKKGITVMTISSQFLLYRVMDDPTGHDMRLWNDLSHLIRFGEGPRKIVNSLMAKMDRPYYGVHFRAENDTIWSSADHQMQVDLDALDTAWVKYGKPGSQKPLVYLACGDEDQVNRFKEAGKARGWEVTHKWLLAEGDDTTLQLIKDLAFDFQGAVDMGMMVRSHFFLGIIGSAFSSTVGNARDVTGRYRGSSFNVWDDGNARSHLFNDGDAGLYACCL